MNTPVGTCGSCGGPVTVPSPWLGVIPPVPTCEQCGRQAANGYGPRIPMQDDPPPKQRFTTTTTTNAGAST